MEMNVITHKREGSFGSRIASITLNGNADQTYEVSSYVVSTAKQGFFKGLSTKIYRSSKPPFGATSCIRTLIYSNAVSKDRRYEEHEKLVDLIDSITVAPLGIEFLLVFRDHLQDLVDLGILVEVQS